ncbi:spermatogenesis-associated protein 9 isoform X1 [Mirounga angustirostris]|uniref:spermatogenesis-associated protein 9 isoform X1 n=1 Tax=Mirounga angustirostris TaxID=9716 RepID=UPI00313BEE36
MTLWPPKAGALPVACKEQHPILPVSKVEESIRRYAAAQKSLLNSDDYKFDERYKREPMQKPSKIRMAVALARINRGTLIQGLNSISRSSKSVAKLLQPQLACRLLELRDISHRLLREVNAPKQPLYNVQVRRGSLFEMISFPAKTALTSIMYASYAALIYLTVCVNAVLEKVKKIFQEEESIRQNREESENLRKAFSEPVLSEPTFPEGEIRAKPYRSLPEKPDNISDCPKLPANKLNNKIQVLHSVFDQSAEMNE